MVLNTDGAAISKPTKTQIRSARRRRQKAAERGPDWVAPEVARTNEAGDPKRHKKSLAKRLRNKALKAACKAAEQATTLAGDAAEASQKRAFQWQKGQNGRPGFKLEPTLSAAERLAAAKAVLSSSPPDQLLKVKQHKPLHSNPDTSLSMQGNPLYVILGFSLVYVKKRRLFFLFCLLSIPLMR